MAMRASIRDFLGRAHVPFTVVPHRPAFTAHEEAAVLHVPGRDWAKVVVCFADDEPILAVVPADLMVDLDRLRELTGADKLRLANEEELELLFPDCERGAMPPFGPLYRLQEFVDETLSHEREIVFNAGTHRDAIWMRYADFVDLTHPIVAKFGKRPHS
jgi:Ala-tRNA(Pro) deacylase